MKSKASLFNKRLCTDVLKRSWPLFLCYFAALLCELPMNVVSVRGSLSRGYEGKWTLDGAVYDGAVMMPNISFVFAVLAVMLLFGYLYNSRSCGMMAVLPIKRVTMFCTVYAAGLMMFVLIDLLVALLTIFIFAADPHFSCLSLLYWLEAALLSNISFYGFAVFCAMLTGSMIILPGVYTVLSFTAAVAESAVRAVLGEVVFGYMESSSLLTCLSPVCMLYENFTRHIEYGIDGNSYSLLGMELLIVYSIIGLAFSVVALFLYEKRRMETAGDTVAIPVLKPIFKYCLAFGAALVLGAVGFKLVFNYSFEGGAATAIIAVLMLVGAFLGYFIAEMLIQKTFYVFSSGWRGMSICWLVCLSFIIAAEADIFGYERYVPELEQIESVSVNPGVYDIMPELTESGQIEAVLEMHRVFIEEKSSLEQVFPNDRTMNIVYKLKNGGSVERLYRYPCDYSTGSGLESVAKLEELVNSPAAREYRLPELTENIEIRYPSIYYYDKDSGNYVDITLKDEAIDLYNECVRPDGMETALGCIWLLIDDPLRDSYAVNINMDFHEQGYGYRTYVNVNITPDAYRTLEWIYENTDIEPILSSEVKEIQSMDVTAVG